MSKTKKYDTVIVIGAGAFGTSIASVLSHNFKHVICKVRSQDIYDGLKSGENTIYLPGQKLGSNIVPAMSFEEAHKICGAGKVDLIVWGLPSSIIKDYCDENDQFFRDYLEAGIPVVCLSKGIDQATLELPDDLFYSHYYDYLDLFTFLSGPSFAQEILDQQITLVSLAGRSTLNLKKVQKMLESSYFKVFPTYDVKGVLLGGALKNVLAIAGGIIEGLGYNHNTRAAMITRGITEMLRFGLVFNARPETFYGLSGMGDLILTTTGGLSRNKKFGLELAKGRDPKEIINSQRSVVEGYKTSLATYLLAEKYNIRARIFRGVHKVLYENEEPHAVIKELMAFKPRFEF